MVIGAVSGKYEIALAAALWRQRLGRWHVDLVHYPVSGLSCSSSKSRS